jgi:hypothetical protein
VLEVYTTEDQSFVVRYLREKGLNAGDIREEMFLIYGGKCLSRKAVHNWMANFSLLTIRLKRKCVKWLTEQSTDFYATGFDALVKR